METNEMIEGFLDRVQQLDKQRQREDKDRRERRPEEAFAMSSTTSNFVSSKNSIPHSESINNFNASVSKEYRLDMDELVYESAYNYDKSRNKENQHPATTSSQRRVNHDSDTDEPDHSKIASASRSVNYKKYENLDIIRFDDFVTKGKKRAVQPDQSSVSSKFELNDEQKKRMDETLSSLIGVPVLQKQSKGGSWSLSGKSESSPQTTSQQMKRSPRKFDLESPSKAKEPLPTPSSPIKKSPAKVHINRFMDEDEDDRPKLPTRPQLRDELAVKPLLPVRPELRGFPLGKKKPEVRPKSALITSSYLPNTPSLSENGSSSSQEKPSSKPPIRPKSTWLESTMKNSTSTPQGTPERHIHISYGKSTWLTSATRASTSTEQGLKNTTHYTIDKDSDKKTWLNSAKSHSTYTSQGLDNTSKVSVTCQDGPASWLESAKKVSNVKPFEQTRPKITPIVPSKSNTLSRIMEENELSKSHQEKTLKELTNAKLNHIDSSASPPKTQHKDEMNFQPLTLKKTRGPPIPSHTKQVKEPFPELTGVKLKPALPTRKPSFEVPEALKRSQTLKPASPTRKASMEVPEALKKSQTLKPAVPLRKPSLEVPEALVQVGALKEAKPLPEKEKVVPEGLRRSRELRPAPPKRKVSAKELEALSALNELKKSKTPVGKANLRTASQSKELLSKKLQGLKHVEENKPDPEPLDKRAMLERVLQRAQTAPAPMLMVKKEDVVPSMQAKRASTFDNSKITVPDEALMHPNKTRSRGPKRRTPKSVK